MIVSRCCDCNHRDLCKYRDEYEKVIRNISVVVPEPFTLSLNCKHYYTTCSYLTGKLDSTAYSNCSYRDGE